MQARGLLKQQVVVHRHLLKLQPNRKKGIVCCNLNTQRVRIKSKSESLNPAAKLNSIDAYRLPLFVNNWTKGEGKASRVT